MKIFLYGLLAATCMTTGCRSHNLSKAYEPRPPVIQTPKAETLLVEFPAENRPLKGKSKNAPAVLAMIPLIPYGHVITAPELYMRGRYKYSYSFNKDLQDAVVNDLKNSGIFQNVYAGERVIKDTRISVLDLAPVFQWEGKTNTVPKGCRVLSLRLDEGVMHRNFTMYGLSVAAMPLWIIGAPTGYCHFDLRLTAELKDDSGKTLAERSFAGKEKYTEWLYNASSGGLNAMPAAYDQISGELRCFVMENTNPGE